MENSLFGLAAYERTGEAVVRGSEEQEPEMSPNALIRCALARPKLSVASFQLGDWVGV